MTVHRPPTAAQGAVAGAISEADLLANVRALAGYAGWRTYHTHRSDRSEKGWPDLALVRGPVAWFAELKTLKGQPTADQCAWLEALAGVREVHAVLWRPDAWLSGEITEALA